MAKYLLPGNQEENGGSFFLLRYKIQLEASEPEPLDTFEITSPLNITSSARFMLDSDTKGEKFNAEFTYDSASEFTVIPKTGILNPMIKYEIVKS